MRLHTPAISFINLQDDFYSHTRAAATGDFEGDA